MSIQLRAAFCLLFFLYSLVTGSISICAAADLTQQDPIDVGAIYDAAYSHDGTRIATATVTGLQIWDAETFDLLSQYTHENGLHVLKWSPDDSKIYAGQIFTEETYHIVYNPNSEDVVFDFDRSLRWIGYPTGAYIDPPRGHKPGTNPTVHNNFVAFSSDATLLALITSENTIEIFNIIDGNQILNRFVDETESVFSIGMNITVTHLVITTFQKQKPCMYSMKSLFGNMI